MNSSWLSVGAFLALMVCLPWVVKWYKSKALGDLAQAAGQSRLISAIAVGPQQKVVTIEVGPSSARVWLTLGVTAQAVTCLHTCPVELSDSAKLRGQGEDIATV